MTWCEKVSARFRGCEFFMPDDERNPMKGWYCVAGPTGETGVSHESMEHAAVCFLAHIHNDPEANEALRRRRGSVGLD